MEGAAIANAVTFGVSNAVRLALVWRFVRIQPYDGSYLRLLGPALAGLAAMLLVHPLVDGSWALDLVVTGLAGAAVYIAAFLLVGLTAEERQGLARLRSRLGRR